MDWTKKNIITDEIVGYDIEPKREDIIKRDTLLNPLNYKDTWIITNPPYLARNKSKCKDIFNLYNTNDLYKCFIKTLTQNKKCLGGIIIIPAGLFFSSRDIDNNCRNEFMSNYKIIQIKYFEEKVFNDTNTTVVAILFELSDKLLVEQDVKWIIMPSKEERIFNMSYSNNWIIGGDIYKIYSSKSIKVSRYVLE